MLTIDRKLLIWIFFAAFLAAGCTKTQTVHYTVSVESVNVAPLRLEMYVRERITLKASVLPENAVNKTIAWSSSNSDIVSVDERGRIRANSPGTASITVTSQDGGKKASCSIRVNPNELFSIAITDFPEFSGSVSVPYGKVFDLVRADISGVDWQVISTLEATISDDVITLSLPETLPADQLSKVGRDTYNDYEGFWPAEEISDRSALVADLGDITAYLGSERVGRFYLTNWDGTLDGAPNSCRVYFHYSDRPFTLSGNNLRRPGQNISVVYHNASFSAGWNAYATIDAYTPDGEPSTANIVTTDIPSELPLTWRFE